jgi:hypothetical protein
MINVTTPRIIWRNSTHGSGDTCVEVSTSSGATLVRDSKDAAGPTIALSAKGWTAFLSAVQRGQFELMHAR